MCWHNWGKWKDIETGELVTKYSDMVIRIYIVQQRECSKCGKKQVRTISA